MGPEGTPSTAAERPTTPAAREFARAAKVFAARTKGRFDDLDVVPFSQAVGGETVVEVGVGAGEFLFLWHGIAARLVGIDLTLEMLHEARSRHPDIHLVLGDGARLPLPDRCIDLVTSAQMLHHVVRPVPVVMEMGRVVAEGGRLLIVDQVAPERYEEAVAMTELEKIRDPSHAASRPPSALRTIVRSAGLEIVDERIVTGRQRAADWMWPGEFPEERIAAVGEFIEQHGAETGMDFTRDGDEWVFTRRRMMLLAAQPSGEN